MIILMFRLYEVCKIIEKFCVCISRASSCVSVGAEFSYPIGSGNAGNRSRAYFAAANLAADNGDFASVACAVSGNFKYCV